MNRLNAKWHKRCSIRLKYYDYSSEGLYFITICCKNKIHFFGEVNNGKMVLNHIGKIVQQCWLDIPKHFPNVSLHPFVIMPNHCHGIIEIVGANNYSPLSEIDTKGAKNFSPLQGTSKTVGSIVRGFKIGVTKWARQNTHIYAIWQRNYYEHIIRNERSYFQIIEYMENNPFNWQEDCFYS